MLINEKHLAELNSQVQTINARVELHNGSTLAQICTCNDYLKSFTVERVGEGKFFGYGICHKLIVNFIDFNKELNLTNIDFMEVTFGVDGEFIYPFPTFHVLEVNRDETTNEISVIAYDRLYQATNYQVSDLTLPSSYSLLYFASACAALLGISVKFENIKDVSAFMVNYPEGDLPNFDGTETVRQALDALAEATQTIYYLNGDWQLTFRRLDQAGAVVSTIDKNHYMELKSGANCRLGAITHTTELGDSVTATIIEDGVTQYLRDNPFLELREDIGALLNNAVTTVGGLTINPFDCSWVGNYLLEIGDKVAFIAEDDGEIVTYIVDDSITFDGTLAQRSRWEFLSDEAETANNPTSLGEALNKTFARVDKANKRIDLMASDVSEYGSKIAQLEITTDGMKTTVSNVQKDVSTAKDDITGLKTTTSTHTSEIGALQVSSNNISLRVQKVEEEIKTFEELETGQFIERVAEIEIELDNITTRVSETETNITNVDGKAESNTSKIGALEVNTESISASVQKNQKEVKEQIGALNDEITSTKSELSNFKLESNNALLTFQTTVTENGVTKVDTGTGFKFDENGLNISKTNSEISTTITEDGMAVSRYGENVLVANNQGVKAEDLHATTYLIIGNNSRFEDYNGRTACFWIGN
jgi:predicted  nucleic acid-binding Zn-ribbon protein